MKRSQITYNHGEPVWAKVDGFPWWPARVVSRHEITLDEGEPEPQVHPDEALIEFFNDNKRFAPVPLKNLRPFLNTRPNINRDYSGEYLDDVRIATREAKDYIAKRDASKQTTFAPPTLKKGEPVWAKADGYPWWPAKILSTDRIAPGNPVRVEFFAADRPSAPVANIFPFRNPSYANLNTGYKGTHLQSLTVAVKEATAYLVHLDNPNINDPPRDNAISAPHPGNTLHNSPPNKGRLGKQLPKKPRKQSNGAKRDTRDTPNPAAPVKPSSKAFVKPPNPTTEQPPPSSPRTPAPPASSTTAVQNALKESAEKSPSPEQQPGQGLEKPSVQARAKNGRCFRIGEVVWAKFTGFPWWPARLVERQDITLDPGEPEPELGEAETLVEFFNDEQRFAVIPLEKLHPFFNKRYANQHRSYNGQYVDSFQGAVKEAEEYSKKIDVSKKRALYW